ncbi:MAG: VanW family protein [Propioniciclava sp.]
MAETKSTRPEGGGRPRRGLILGGVAAGVVVLAGVAYGVGYALSGNTLAPKTTIAGVDVGGLAPAEAEAKLTAELAQRSSDPITLTAADQSTTRTPQELGLAVDYAASVRAAGGGKSFDPRVIWENLTGGGEQSAVVGVDRAAAESALGDLSSATHVDPANAELAIVEGTPTVTDASAGRALDLDATIVTLQRDYLTSTQVEAALRAVDPDVSTQEANDARTQVADPALSGPITLSLGDKTLEVSAQTIGSALTFEAADGALVPRLNSATLLQASEARLTELGMTEPKDASFTFTDGRPTVVPSTDGNGVSADSLATAVSATMTKTADRVASVETGPLQASFTTQDAEKLGIKEVTGEFTTSFPATAYRVNNIGKSAGLVNGVLVKPGETFSMNKVLGPRTLALGWMAGGAIDGGKVVERMGGGISQTTTTTFNAIFFAGLEDVYHKPHSLYFSRYPMGREATLDYVSVDMKFKNNSQYGVLLQAYTNNPKVGGQGTVTVKVWSTKTYDEVKASDPVQSEFRSPGAAIQSDAAVCSPQSSMQGFRVDYNRLFYQGGQLVKTEPFTWTYNTLQAVTCTNPAARADRIER